MIPDNFYARIETKLIDFLRKVFENMDPPINLSPDQKTEKGQALVAYILTASGILGLVLSALAFFYEFIRLNYTIVITKLDPTAKIPELIIPGFSNLEGMAGIDNGGITGFISFIAQNLIPIAGASVVIILFGATFNYIIDTDLLDSRKIARSKFKRK